MVKFLLKLLVLPKKTLILQMQHTRGLPSWSTTSVTERSNMLLKIAQVMEDNLEYLATLETIDNGKPTERS
jgi:acyl-CoA reductase-like NAD-dependent aldehyde dehydrogenase